MGKSIRRKKSGSGLFSKEIIGMALVLFSVLSFLCLFVGDIIYPVGSYVRGFWLGVFGYYSFLFLIYTLIFGVNLVVGKSLFSKKTRVALFVVSIFIFAIFGLMHVAVNMKADSTFSEGVGSAFGACKLTLSTSTLGGAFFTVVSHPIIFLVKRIGAYIFYIIIALICFMYFANKYKVSQSKQNSKNKKPTQADTRQIDALANNNQSRGVDALAQPDLVRADTNNGSRLFLFGDNSFGLKSASKDKRKNSHTDERESYNFSFGASTSPIITKSGAINSSSTYTQSYVDDFESKLNYVTTPRKPDLNNIGQTPMDARNPNANTEPNRQAKYAPYGADDQKDVYSINRTRQAQPINSFDRASRLSNSTEVNSRLPFDDVDARQKDVSNDRAYGSMYDRVPSQTERNNTQGEMNIPSERSPFESNDRATDRFMRADFKRKEDLSQSHVDEGVANSPVRTTGFSEQSSTDASNRVYNPYKKENPVEKPVAQEINDNQQPAEISRRSARDAKPTDLSSTTSELSKTNVTKEALGVADDKKQAVSAPSVQPKAEESVSAVSVEPIAKPKKPAPIKVEPVEEDKPNPIDLMPVNYRYKAPPLNLLHEYGKDEEAIQRNIERQRARADVIVTTFQLKNIDVKIEDIICGPAVTRFVVSVPQGVPMKTVAQTQTDLQVWLEASSEIRMLIPIPGTSKIGIEVPNEKSTIVGLKEILSSKEYKNTKQNSITFALGKDIVGNPILLDVMEMPHLIVAGATGTGKSVCLNAMLISLLYRYSPEDLRLVIVDPKMVEFEMYKGLPHLMFDDIIGIDGRALSMLEWATIEMDRRYMLFKDVGARKLTEYNAKVGYGVDRKLPYIIILIDEFAELMMTANEKKKVENYVGRLAQKARAAGISLIFATQRPSADVIDGSIKTNFTSRICFKTSSNVDSQVVIMQPGAETLLGKGDVLFKTTSMTSVERAQGALIGDDEVKAVTDYVRDHNKAYYDEKALELINKANQVASSEKDGGSYGSGGSQGSSSEDPDAIEDVYLRALRLIILTRNVSKTHLQTKLGVGYPKAAKIIDWMEEEGFISSAIDNKQRTIFITREQYESRFGEFTDSYK